MGRAGRSRRQPRAPSARWIPGQHAVALAAGDPRLRLGYGEALEKSGDLAGAERELRKASYLEPAFTDAQAALANLFMRAKRLPEAERHCAGWLAAPQDEAHICSLGAC